ncbi:hypothetical protein BSKO_13362 [Bryopsis sp. KO-2023]|nr:hypothetical protein BSKO_13362 [Bryopsis sp. KO-2023]
MTVFGGFLAFGRSIRRDFVRHVARVEPSSGVLNWEEWKSMHVDVSRCPPENDQERAFGDLGLPEPEWTPVRQKAKETSEKTPLFKNLKLLKEWGLTSAGIDTIREHRKLSDLRPDVVESKLNWLVDELGFDEKQSVKIVRNYPLYLGLSVEENVRPFVRLFLDEGVSKRELRDMIMDAPEILGRRGKFSHLLEYFESELGFDRREVIEVLLQFTKVMFLSIEEEIKPMVACFKEVGMEFADMVSMLKKRPQVMLLNLEREIKPKLWEVHNLGFSKEGVGKVVSGCPFLMWKDYNKMVVQHKMDFLANKVGFGREETMRVVERDPMKLIDNLRTWRETHKWFLMNGLGKEESVPYFKTNMDLLSRRWEGLQEKLDFARDVLGKSTEEVMRCPRYFNASFEKVTFFRTAFLSRVGFDYTKKALGFLIVSNRIFEKRFGKKEIARFKREWDKMSLPQRRDCILKQQISDIGNHQGWPAMIS